MYDLYCEKMHCHMSYAACVKRQSALAKQMARTNGYSTGHRITTDECLGCAQGEESIKKMETQAEFKLSPAEAMKVCNRKDCAHGGKPQPLEEFDKNKNNKTGYAGNCKSCRRKDQLKLKLKKKAQKKPTDSQPSIPDSKPPATEYNHMSAKEKLKNHFVKMMDAGSSLSEAYRVINGDRQDSYGSPEDSFEIIADFWRAYLRQRSRAEGGKVTLSALDVAHMMTLFKIARMLGQSPCRDNYIDAQGYLAIAADRLLHKAKDQK